MPQTDRQKRKLTFGISDIRMLRVRYAEELTALGVTDILKTALFFRGKGTVDTRGIMGASAYFRGESLP